MRDERAHDRGPAMVGRDQAGALTGPVVVIDVLRAFTTAAYALGAGAARIVLADSLDEVRELAERLPGALTLGERHGHAVEGFDFTNSPARIARAELAGRTLIQRTTSGTRGVLAAHRASAIWAASLVNAAATARALVEAGAYDPVYVISGRFPDDPASGRDDEAVAGYIEALRRGGPVNPAAAVAAVRDSAEARYVASLPPDSTDPDDVAYAVRVDVFSFAMPVRRRGDLTVIERPGSLST